MSNDLIASIINTGYLAIAIMALAMWLMVYVSRKNSAVKASGRIKK